MRGTTLKKSILNILDRLSPKKIIIVSSAPQIRYPDCYGIDMARLKDFVAFRAAIALLKETGQENIMDAVYAQAKEELNKPTGTATNAVKEIYAPFTDEQLSKKISSLLTPSTIKAEVGIVYQKVAARHQACPKNKGDWYFTGNYPTPGGVKVVNRAFVNYMEGLQGRAY